MAKLRSAEEEYISYNGVRGQFGEVTYFVTTLSLRDAVENLHLLSQSDLSFSERIQRVLNQQRVEKEILPYLQGAGYRFFNSMVVIPIPDPGNRKRFWLEQPPEAEAGVVEKWTTLKMHKDVERVVVDGQHRKRALELFQADSANRKLLTPLDVPVVFVFFDSIGREGKGGRSTDRREIVQGTRRLFRDINLTARAMDQFTGLLIDDANMYGVMARELLEGNAQLEKFTKWSSGMNLAGDDAFMTSIGVLADVIAILLTDEADRVGVPVYGETDRKSILDSDFEGHPDFDISTKKIIEDAFGKLKAFEDWRATVKNAGLKPPQQPEQQSWAKEAPREKRKKLEAARKENLLYTVAGQKALFQAIYEAFGNRKSTGSRAYGTLLSRIDTLYSERFFHRIMKRRGGGEQVNPMWRDIIVGPNNTMLHAKKHWQAAGMLIAYVLGAPHSEDAIQHELEQQFELGSYDVAALKRLRAG